MDCCNHQCEACHKHKERTPEEMKALINRLNRIEGQVRGIRGMVENSAYCPDILTQVAATSAALNAFTKELLASHIRSCVADDIRAGHDEAIDELVQTLQKLAEKRQRSLFLRPCDAIFRHKRSSLQKGLFQ